ncbi:MAG TPA: hypothetical protein VFE14_08165 [Micromonosporaceae bacterium]|jgi:hypothetical protein|nr:hypothetical protein [Micromonosporaceae bacterium]
MIAEERMRWAATTARQRIAGGRSGEWLIGAGGHHVLVSVHSRALSNANVF